MVLLSEVEALADTTISINSPSAEISLYLTKCKIIISERTSIFIYAPIPG